MGDYIFGLSAFLLAHVVAPLERGDWDFIVVEGLSASRYRTDGWAQHLLSKLRAALLWYRAGDIAGWLGWAVLQVIGLATA